MTVIVGLQCTIDVPKAGSKEALNIILLSLYSLLLTQSERYPLTFHICYEPMPFQANDLSHIIMLHRPGQDEYKCPNDIFGQ